MNASVVVPTSGDGYGRRLDNCLRSIRAQSVQPERLFLGCLERRGELGSVRRLTEQAIEHEATIVFAQHDSTLWPPSLARNICFRHVQSEVVATVDADAVLHPRTLEMALERLASDGKAVVRVQTKLMPYKSDHAMFRNLSPASFEKNAQQGAVARGPGCCIVARTRDIESIHGWDEAYVGHGVADWDFVCRLKMQGLHLISLSAVDGVWSMHQDHERAIDRSAVQRNLALFSSIDKKASPLRNMESWGGMPSSFGQPGSVGRPEQVICANDLSQEQLLLQLSRERVQSPPKDGADLVVVLDANQPCDASHCRVATLCRENGVPLRVVRK